MGFQGGVQKLDTILFQPIACGCFALIAQHSLTPGEVNSLRYQAGKQHDNFNPQWHVAGMQAHR